MPIVTSPGSFVGWAALKTFAFLLTAASLVAEPSSQTVSASSQSIPVASGWKYEVPILTSSDQYTVKLPQFRDALYTNEAGWLYLRLDLHFSARSDFYYPCFEERILLSKDKGLTWSFVDGPWPGPRDTRSVLPDGTIVETGTHCFVDGDRWERYPIGEADKLKENGYFINPKGGDSGFCSLLYDFWARRSTDGGKTWTVQPLHKKLPFFAYIASRHYQRAMDDGTIIAFFSGRPTADGPRSAYAVRSEDGGLAWELVTVADGRASHLDAGLHESFPVVFPDGRIFAMIRSQLGDDAYLVRSLDGGKTWSKPQRSPIRAKHPVPTLLKDGTIVVTYPRRWARPHGLRARFTSDLGKTWSEEIVLKDDLEFEDGIAHPVTIELGDGTLFTVGHAKKMADEKRFCEYTFGLHWTRDYAPRIGPKLPVPPRRPMFNGDRKDQSPWDRAAQRKR